MIRERGYNVLTAGKLRHLCDVVELVSTGDGEGGSVSTYQTKLANVPCLFDTNGNSRALEESQVAYVKNGIMYMRFMDLVNTDKIEFDGDMWTIHSITNIDFKDRWLEVSIYA